MDLKFTKMHGLGNDFIVIDAISQHIRLNRADIKRLSHRHTGIGFDQCLVVEPSTQANVDFNYRIFNADGSEVGQCGNGARCLARFIADKKLSDKKTFTVLTQKRQMSLRLLQAPRVSVDMGKPLFSPQHIPMRTGQVSSEYSLDMDQQHYRFHAVNMGNPHAILVVSDIQSAKVEDIGKLLSQDPFFPEGANINFMQIHDKDTISLRVYERGVGETLACGSGACASAVAAIRYHRTANKLTVSLPGGRCEINWAGEGAGVELIGPAETVFEGVVSL